MYADVAHNPESARYLATKLSEFRENGKRIIALVGMLQDKDQQAVFKEVVNTIDEWHFADLNCYRGDNANNVTANFNATADKKSAQHNSVEAGLNEILPNISKDELLIGFGSFYTVADAIAYWQSKE